jgi:hypothetical protein
MIDLGMPPTTGALDIGCYLYAAQAKWERLTASDYAGIRSVDELITAVEVRYSLSHREAKADVEGWLRVVRP